MSAFKADAIVIAGTYDGRQIISELAQNNIKVWATVTTSFGKELIEENPNVMIHNKVLPLEEMVSFIKSAGAGCLIDASHPYAQIVSQNAMEACKQASVKYIRFERANARVNKKDCNELYSDLAHQIIYAKDYEEAADIANSFQGNILLTTGSKTLDIFFRKGPDFIKRLFVRVLPDSKVLARCEDAGLSRGNIIAVKGPFSEQFNIDTIKHVNAQVLVTKDSGDVGGTDEKISAALRLGIKAIVIERPSIEYECKSSDINEVVRWTKSIIAKESI